jgi:hypothetical protein
VVNDPVAVALSVAQILEACGLRYLVGGSLASSLSGEPRSTLDVDIVVEMTTSDVDRMAEALRAEFDVDDRAVARAVERQRLPSGERHQGRPLRHGRFTA